MSLLSQFFGGSKIIPIEVFLVGGGGGGGSGANSNTPGNTYISGGGGGAGQVLYANLNVIAGITYTVEVGAGGAGGVVTPVPAIAAFNGSYGSFGTSSRFGTLNAFGGGGGATGSIPSASPPVGFASTSFGSSGGCGFSTITFGPVYFNSSVESLTFRLQNPGFQSSLPATAAGSASPPGISGNSGGGGGGATSGGPDGTLPANNRSGGNGVAGDYIGFSTVFGGGGGGGRTSGTNPLPPAGSLVLAPAPGGGGVGAAASGNGPPSPGTGVFFANSTSGQANSGGGGGGGAYVSNPAYPSIPTPTNAPFNAGSSGGSGTVIIRYPTAYNAAVGIGTTSGGWGSPHITQPGYYVYKWNSGPGSITFS